MRLLITKLLAYMIFAGSPAAKAQSDADTDAIEIQKKQLSELGTYYAAKLYRKCPPQKCFILNFGLTSVFASAYFREKISNPDDRARYYSEVMVRDLNLADAYIKPHLEALFRLFDAVIPPPEILNGRPVIINRVLWAGKTFALFNSALKKYIMLKRPDLKLGVFIIYNSDLVAHINRWDALNDHDFFPRIKIIDKTFTRLMIDAIDRDKPRLNHFLASFSETAVIHWPDLISGRVTNLRAPNPEFIGYHQKQNKLRPLGFLFDAKKTCSLLIEKMFATAL